MDVLCSVSCVECKLSKSELFSQQRRSECSKCQNPWPWLALVRAADAQGGQGSCWAAIAAYYTNYNRLAGI